jgi:hypothetical protein
MFALAQADAGGPERQVYDVVFAPLERQERRYADLGPVGPYYPERASRAHQSGEAILQCQAEASGRLQHCAPVAETRGGWGFAIAARIMADRKRIMAAGSPTAGETILVRVPFSLGAPVTTKP